MTTSVPCFPATLQMAEAALNHTKSLQLWWGWMSRLNKTKSSENFVDQLKKQLQQLCQSCQMQWWNCIHALKAKQPNCKCESGQKTHKKAANERGRTPGSRDQINPCSQ
jgi:hypothetical protein